MRFRIKPLHRPTTMRRIGLLAFATLLLPGIAFVAISTAQADYLFSGTGVNGNFTGQASEPYLYNYDMGPQNDWGSPGVGHSETFFLEKMPVVGFEITFIWANSNGMIDPSSVALGNSDPCSGGPFGGTIFCNSTKDITWHGSLIGSDTIEFLASSPAFGLSKGDLYFANVFFVGALPTAFTGAWLTATPLPAALPLFATGLGALGLLGWRRKRTVRLTVAEHSA